MLKIKHRVNSVSEMLLTDPSLGIEVDLRANNSEIYLSHDPFVPGELFKDLLSEFNHQFIILNVKEDGLEENVVKMLNSFGIEDYFFLDQPFPSLRKSILRGQSCAVRVSEFEPILTLETKPNWIWIDSFTGNWNHLPTTIEFALENSIKTCLVSPELQGRKLKGETDEIQRILAKFDLSIDAVCTKEPEAWCDAK